MTRRLRQSRELTLVRWRVHALDDGDLFCVGYCVEQQRGCTTGVVESLRGNSMTAHTVTSWKYKLEGRPGVDEHALLAWERWLHMNGNPVWRDATARICRERNVPVADAGDDPGSYA